MVLSLVTPDVGLLFWMCLIFGLVFLILLKWGFPLITKMVDERSEGIEKALSMAQDARNRINKIEEEQAALIDKAKEEQLNILREANQTKREIIEHAKQEANIQVEKIFEKARLDIESEKQRTLKDIKKEVANIAIDIAEKVLRKEFENKENQLKYMDSILKDLNKEDIKL